MSDTSTSSAHQVPEKPTIDGLEATWTQRWDEEGIYAFNRAASCSMVTENGSLLNSSDSPVT